MSGQRSFDASRLFGRRRERGEPRRAASEDQRKRDRGSAAEDNEKTIDERSLGKNKPQILALYHCNFGLIIN